MHKYLPNNFICHLSWLKKLSLTHTNSLTSICEIFKTLQVIIFWVRVTRKITRTFNLINIICDNWWLHTLNMVECELHKNSLNNFICHLSWLKKLPPHSYKSPHIHLWILKTLRVIIFWVRVTHKMLNVNCISIYPIILSVTCHGLINFPSLIHFPSYPFVNFQNPISYYFLS